MEACGFKADTKIVKTSLDRPEIYTQVTAMSKPATGFLDLQHLLPSVVTTCLDVPKTIIFMDCKETIMAATRMFQYWMKQLNYPPGANAWISCYFATMAANDKENVASRFQVVRSRCDLRILLVTDAYGLGVDNPDIERGVQWKVSKGLTMSKVMQRMGRLMRCGGGAKAAHFLFLHPKWCIGPRAGRVSDIATSDKNNENRVRNPAVRRALLAPGLWSLMNASSTQCLRQLCLNFFNDEAHLRQDYAKPQPCCSTCDPSYRRSTAPTVPQNKFVTKSGNRRPWFLKAIEEWRVAEATKMYDSHLLQHFPSLILPDTVMLQLADSAAAIQDKDSLRDIIGTNWSELERYADDILELLRRGNAIEVRRGDVLNTWSQSQAFMGVFKKKLRPERPVNPQVAAFNERKASW